MRQVRALIGWLTIGLAVACGGTDSGPTQPTETPGVSLAAPTLESPTGDEQLDTLRPTLIVRNGASGGSGARTYEFQVSDRSDFAAAPASHVSGYTVVVSQTGVPEGVGTTSFTPTTDLQPATRLYWRARLHQGSSASDWSSTSQFRTKLVGFNRAGELYDPLIHGETIGARVRSTTFMGRRGLRVDTSNSWVRYELAATLTSGEISVEVEGLAPNGAGQKARIFSMMDGGNSLFRSKFLFNVQYRGVNGNPNNAIAYKFLMGDEDLKYEPHLGERTADVRLLNPTTTYLWAANWGRTFRLTVREGGASGPLIYDRSAVTAGTYNPSPHAVFLGANDSADESGSYAGAIYRNLWVGTRPRPVSLGSALAPR